MTELPRTLIAAPRRRQAFEFILAEITAGRGFPSRGAISNHMGWKNESSAAAVCSTLCDLDGVLELEAYDFPLRYRVKAGYRMQEPSDV